MDRWRLVIDRPRSGADNMARDQAIRDLYPTVQQPTLRFYGWSPACVSIGLAQRLTRDINQAACQTLGIDIVRRCTGGRAILHDHEVTYALVMGLDQPLVAQSSVVRSYWKLSQALQYGLEQLGVASRFEPEGARQRHGRSSESAACFDQAADYEIVVAGRKLVGSAQARQHDTLLQHGSVLLHTDAKQWVRVLRLPPHMDAAMLEQRMIGLDEVLGVQATFEQVVDALGAGVEARCGITLTPGALTDAEEARAAELVTQRYANAAWTERR